MVFFRGGARQMRLFRGCALHVQLLPMRPPSTAAPEVDTP